MPPPRPRKAPSAPDRATVPWAWCAPRRIALVLAGLLAYGLVGAQAFGQRAADPPEPLTCGRDETGALRCQVDVASQLDHPIQALLENGFTNELVYRLYLFPRDDDTPVGAAVVAFAVVFQLYTDVYYISREGVEGYVERSSWPEARDVLARFEVVLDERRAVPPGAYFAAAVLEVNPVNEAQLLEARRWIAQSRGGYRLFDSRDSSLFGTFVSLFVNVDLGSADVRRVFRSESFEMAP
jgi:hypothetical protein